MLSRLSLESRYVLYRVLNNLIFYNVVWLYFYRIYIDDGQIGLLDSIAFFLGLLFEIPSGAIADAIGRKKVVRFGQLLVVIGILIQVIFPGFSTFVLGQTILVIGMSFVSGSDDALFYSALQYDPESSDWKRLVTRASKWTLIGSLIATISWAYLHTIDPSYPWYLTALMTGLTITALTWVPDTLTRKKEYLGKQILSVYRNILIGIQSFMKSKILIYVPIIVGIQSLLYAFMSWLFRPILLDRFHFSPFMGSIAIGGTILVSIWSLHILEKKLEHIEEWRFFTWIGLLCIASLIVSVWDIGYWGWWVLLALSISERVIHPFLSDGLNKHARESERATILSVGSFLKSIPYVLLAPLIGYLNHQGNLEYFLIFWSVVILVSLILYFRQKK